MPCRHASDGLLDRLLVAIFISVDTHTHTHLCIMFKWSLHVAVINWSHTLHPKSSCFANSVSLSRSFEAGTYTLLLHPCHYRCDRCGEHKCHRVVRTTPSILLRRGGASLCPNQFQWNWVVNRGPCVGPVYVAVFAVCCACRKVPHSPPARVSNCTYLARSTCVSRWRPEWSSWFRFSLNMWLHFLGGVALFEANPTFCCLLSCSAVDCEAQFDLLLIIIMWTYFRMRHHLFVKIPLLVHTFWAIPFVYWFLWLASLEGARYMYIGGGGVFCVLSGTALV